MYSTDLNVNVKANGADTANKQLGNVEKSIKNVTKAIVGLASVNAATRIISAAINVAHAYDDVADAAERMGMSVSGFQALTFAGNSVGVSAEQMTKIFLNAEKAMLKLETTGKGGLANALKALGEQTKLTVADFQNLSGQQGIQKLKDEMDRLNVSHRDQITLLDQVAKGSSKLIPLLDDHGNKLKQLTAAQEELNSVLGLTPEQEESISRLDAAANRTGAAWDLAKTKTVAAFSNILSANADMATKVIGNFGSMIDSTLLWIDTLDGSGDTYEANLQLWNKYSGEVIAAQNDLQDTQENYNELVDNGHTGIAALYKDEILGAQETLAEKKKLLDSVDKELTKHQEKKKAISDEVQGTLELTKTSETGSKRVTDQLQLELQMRRDMLRVIAEISGTQNETLKQDMLSKIKEGTIVSESFFSIVKDYKDAELKTWKVAEETKLNTLLETLNAELKIRKAQNDAVAQLNIQQRISEVEALKQSIDQRAIVKKRAIESDVTNEIQSRINLYKDIATLHGNMVTKVQAQALESIQEEIDTKMQAAAISDGITSEQLAKDNTKTRLAATERYKMWVDYYINLALLEDSYSKKSIESSTKRDNSTFGAAQELAFKKISDDSTIWYMTELGKLNEYQLKYEMSEMEFAERQQELKRKQLEQVSNAQAAYRADMLSAQSNFAGSMVSIGDSVMQAMEAFDGKKSASMKRMFYLTKAFALTQATLNLGAAVSSAAVTGLTPAEKFANMAAVATAVGNVISTIASAKFTPARAQGGQFNRGQYLVGEKGPELVQFGSGGRIATASDTNKMLNGSSAITQNVNIINNTPSKVTTQTDNNGDLIVMIQEVMASETMNPNSKFNKNMNKTRVQQRKF